jgi:hypothetical protein
MPPNQNRRTKGRALPPDPNRSLFKFKLTWLPDADGNQKKSETWYSYDYLIERESFPEGIQKDLRMQWKQLLANIWKHEELYEFVKWLRPHNKDDTLLLYMPNWPEIYESVKMIETKYGWGVLENYVHMVGFNDFALQSVDRSHPRQAGTSPGRVDFKQYYGFKYVHRNDFIVTNLAMGKLIKVDVYDNLMYHSENHLHTLFGRIPAANEPQPMPVRDHAVRGGIPKALGAMIPNFKQDGPAIRE